MMQFAAALLRDGSSKFTIDQVAVDEIRADEVLVRIAACGICHTDLTVRDGLLPVPRPIIVGHEGSGYVERVGAAVTKIKPGDRVALTFMSCGGCKNCGDATPAYCDKFGMLNMSGLRADGTSAISQDGQPVGGHFFGQSSFAHYSVANQRNVIPLPEGMPMDLAGPFGCGIQTGAGAIFNVLKPQPGDTVVVLGAGGVGLSAVMAAVILGCRPIVVEPRADRRQIAMSLGATLAIDPADGNLAQAITEGTDGGARVIVDTTGIPAVIEAAVEGLGTRGALGLIGMQSMTARGSFAIVGMVSKGITIRGIVEGDSVPEQFLPYLMDLHLQGRFAVDKLVKYYDFEQVNAAAADQASGVTIKPILRFS